MVANRIYLFQLTNITLHTSLIRKLNLEEIGTTSKQYVFLLIIELQSYPWFTLYYKYVCDNISYIGVNMKKIIIALLFVFVSIIPTFAASWVQVM